MKSKQQTCYIFGKKGRSKKVKRIVYVLTSDENKGYIFYNKAEYPVRLLPAQQEQNACWTQDLSRSVVRINSSDALIKAAKAYAVARIKAKVVSVGDGDTITVLCQEDPRKEFLPGERLTIRAAWIDAPESDQTSGKNARNRLKELLPNGSNVQITVVKKDLYHRLVSEIYLDEVYLDGESINLKMVREGHAVVYAKYLSGCPNRDEFLRAESLAKWHQLNFWSQDNPTMPWDHREQKRQRQQGVNRCLPHQIR